MSAQVNPVAVTFPEWYGDRAEYETPLKGYLSDVVVRLESGDRYRLYFFDPVRLQQTLEDDVQAGRHYYTEPGLVVLPEVNTQTVRQALECLWRDGFFQR